jgi:7,8-dihydroneopterin aldolase/epimerase/oxygenase
MSDLVRLQAVRLSGHHGVTDAERAEPQPFEVDLVVETDLRRPGGTDAVEDTVDYGPLFEICREVVEGTRLRLLESMATRIAERVLEHPQVDAVTVRVRKLRLPRRGELDYAGVEIRRARIAIDPPGPTGSPDAS